MDRRTALQSMIASVGGLFAFATGRNTSGTESMQEAISFSPGGKSVFVRLPVTRDGRKHTIKLRQLAVVSPEANQTTKILFRGGNPLIVKLDYAAVRAAII